MPKLDPPRPGKRMSVTEINPPERPHTPVPAAAPTRPPPAMPMRPPKELAVPRARLDTLRDSREISVDTILTELASKAEEARAAKAEAETLRAALDASKRAPPVIGSLAPGAERKALIKLAYKLGTPLVLLMGAATAWLTAHTANVEAKIDRVEETRKLDKVVTDPLTEKVQVNERAAVDCRAWARSTDDYYRQVFGKLGVSIPLQPNAPPVTPIETRAPRHRPNAVNSAPVLEVLTPPPPLP